MSRDETTLLDVTNFAGRIVDLTSQWTAEEFEQDDVKQLAILHLFTLLGESARRLTEEFRAAYPEIPWLRVIGMRNKLVHAYDAVDLNLVWETATRIVPDFLASIEALRNEPLTEMTSNEQ